MRAEHVPVTLGSPQFVTVKTPSFHVTEAWFPGGVVLEPHTHDRPILAVTIRGGLRTLIAGRSLECSHGSAWTEPLGERHANGVGADGALVMVVQPDISDEQLVEPFAKLLGEVNYLTNPRALSDAPRILNELRVDDALAPFCLDALAVTLLASAARTTWRDGNGHREPAWLARARDMLHDEWRLSPSLTGVANTVGVHPCHLAHTFRAYFGESVGVYLRRLRANWAVAQLTLPDRPIAQIAAEAGFSDQAHFTRDCRKYFGVTPGAYRKRMALRLES